MGVGAKDVVAVSLEETVLPVAVVLLGKSITVEEGKELVNVSDLGNRMLV